MVSLIIIYIVCGVFFMHKGWWLNPEIILLQEFSKFLVIGFVEESVYRGFGLRACFFAAVHVPAYWIHWRCDGAFSLTEMLAQFLTAFLLGLLFGWILGKSKSV